MSDAITVFDLGKQYRLGLLHEDLLVNKWIHSFRGALSRKKTERMHRDGETVWALSNVSFNVEAGEVVGIIGRNGAGKSTVLKILSRVTAPTTGQVTMNGRVGSLLEVGTGFHPELTGRENVYLNGAILGMRRAEINRKFDEIVEFSEIERFIDTPVKRYSSGMYVRLAFAVAAHLEPEILLVDEVLAVGDAAFQKKCLGKMGAAAKGGKTVLFVSHNMNAVERLCGRCLLFEGGKLAFQGETKGTIKKYLEGAVPKGEDGSDCLPVWNDLFRVAVKGLGLEIVENEQLYDLLLDVHLFAETKMTLGINIAVATADGTTVCSLGSGLTGCNVGVEKDTHVRVVISGINQYLMGGEYSLGIRISIPRVEHLIRLDGIRRFAVPASDIYKTGVACRRDRFGIVPLPVRLLSTSK